MSVEYSSFQQDIFDFIKTGHGDAVIEAMAGSGKTFTVCEGSKLIESGSVLAVAFNVSIVKELKVRLGALVDCRTINGIGHGALMFKFGGKIKLDEFKYRDIIKNLTNDLPDGKDHTEIRSMLGQLVSFIQTCMITYPTTDELDALVSHYTLELNAGQPVEWYYTKALAVLKCGEEMAMNIGHTISFNDQIWLPNLWMIKPKQYSFVFVDEAQDLSRGKLELILRTRAAGGRMIFVGDRRQSIYGFSGADPSAWQNIIDRTNATILPLSICYRCPSSHLDEARKIVPAIQGHPDRGVGVVKTIDVENLTTEVQTNDLIICRTTAPLIRACLQLIAARVPARVMGRDIAKSLISLSKEAQKINPDIKQFELSLNAATDAKIAAVKNRKNFETLKQALDDRRDGLLACFEGIKPLSYDLLWYHINDMFSDKEAVVTLATVHRVKGLERERVLILNPELLGVFGKQPWQKEQEQNLKYVALTRSKNTLIYVIDGYNHGA